MRRGLSLVGLLVAIVILGVLYAVATTAMKGTLTGTNEDGGYVANSAPALEDKMHLHQLMQALNVAALSGGRGGFPRPGDRTKDASHDTTANVYSLLIAERMVAPEQLISPMDRGWVMEYQEYDWNGYDPSSGIVWDTGFSADLDDESNVSYAHMVLFGDRATRWSRADVDSSFPIFSNRGPEDGEPSEASLACLPDGTWAGHAVFGDGHVAFIGSASGAARSGGDHFFRLDDAKRHADALLGFTASMDARGPTLQWD